MMDRKLCFFLIGLRMMAIGFPGYIHPDEFFQSPEVMAQEVFGLERMAIPWEFSCQLEGKLYRSIVPIWITSGFAFQLLNTTNNILLFAAPRLMLFTLSLICDVLFQRLFPRKNAILMYLTSWVTVVFLPRPFSNTLEAMLLLFCMYFAQRLYAVWLGFAVALGCFTRITFPAFALPSVVYILHAHLGKTRQFIKALVKLAIGAILCASMNVFVDTCYTKAHDACTHQLLSSVPVVLPAVNNLLYNMDVKNLAEHGIHPRYTHILLNMSMLFSPVWLVAFLPSTKTSNEKEAIPRKFVALLRSTIVSGLLVLSLVPHQEARFLIPLVIPVSALCGEFIFCKAVRVRLWVLFNTALGVFFGVLHQGGIVRALLDLNRVDCLATYKTYSAPRHLLGNSGSIVVDLGGVSPAAGVEILQNIEECQHGNWTLLVGSSVQDFPLAHDSETVIIKSYGPHFSGEDPPINLNELALDVYRISVRT